MLQSAAQGTEFMKLNRERYLDKVLGCWAGKNIGGTLGAPMEGKRDVFHCDFYTQSLDGEPAPNDDLDLQLAWLKAMEDVGLVNMNVRILGESSMRYVCGPWNEYRIARNNIACGLPPPLSGSTGNDVWKNSNGAWIRSEVWACVFAGVPDWAAWYAWCDACVDHADAGIEAELFTASLEAAAFVESDIRALVECALARISPESRVARSVRLAMKCRDEGRGWEEAREAVVADSADLGWFQAPANVAFAVIGLLWGDGDFGKSICTAVNCGDDTDCTGATVGAVLGIVGGYGAIPERWIKPIGHGIRNVAVNAWNLRAPRTIEELTRRVAAMRDRAAAECAGLPSLTDGPDEFPPDLAERLADGGWFRKVAASRAPNRLFFNLPWCDFSVEYCDGAIVEPGKPVRLRLRTDDGREDTAGLLLRWRLPEGWTISPGPEQALMLKSYSCSEVEVAIVPGPMAGAYEFVPLEARLTGRLGPQFLTVPFRLKGAAAPCTDREPSALRQVREKCLRKP